VSSAEAALESAMLAVLSADEDVRAHLGDPLRVLRSGSPRPAYPYLEIVRHESEPSDGAAFEGAKHRIDMRVVARDPHGSLALEAMVAARTALAIAAFGAPPPMEGGWRCVLMAPVFCDVVQMSDGTWRALLRVKAAVEAA
jgi:hypothetical protein